MRAAHCWMLSWPSSGALALALAWPFPGALALALTNLSPPLGRAEKT
ncbi:MAG: hypothetical protein ACI83P_000501 [Janthinobacterium sp.]|jgi:hypothetical protein